MDALTAAAQSVEAAQHVRHQQQLHVRIHAQTLNSHEDQQQPRQPDVATTGTPVPVATTPTMRLTSILNADPESDEADIEFVGTANAAPARESDFVWRNSGAVNPAVPMRGNAHHQANGDMGAGIVGGMAMGAGIRWPPDVQRSTLASDSRTDIGARVRQQQQQQYQSSPSQYELQHQWQQQQQQQLPQHQQYQQQNQLEQQSQPTTKKKAPAKRERAAPPPVQLPATATATAASPAASARAKIAKLSSILASGKFIGNKSNSPVKMSERTHSTTTLNHGMWSSEEKAAFHEAFGLHGKNWDKVAACIPTRTRSQVSSFGQKIVRAAAKAADSAPPAASTSSASAATSASTNESKSASGESKQQLNLARDASDNNGVNPQHLAEDALYQLSQAHQVTLAQNSGGIGSVVTTTHVLDLVNGKPSQRPRRGARLQETKPVVSQPAALPVVQAPAPAPAPAVNEVIEINTEESAAETPQKAPQRTTSRPPRARVPSAKVRNQQQQQVAMPQRKKPKLSVVVSRDASSDDAPMSPSSFSVTSGSGVAARGGSSSKPKPKRGKKRPPHEFDGITSPVNASSSSSSVDERECEFCRSARGTCAIMNCTSCKRVYHAKCFVNHFKPYCTSDEPIEKQLELLHLNAPSQVKVKIFRCVPCQAAFIENFKKGGYEWDCECPSCAAPQKTAEYRRRLLLQFVYNKVDEKLPSSKRKNMSTAKQASDAATREKEENNSGAAAAKPHEAKKPTRTGTRRTRNTSAPGSENELMEVDSKVSIEVPQAVLNAAAVGKKKPNKKNASKGFADDTHAESKTETLESEANNGGENGVIETDAVSAIANDQVGGDPITQNEEQEDDQMDCEMDGDAVAEPDEEKEASSRSSPISKPSNAVGDNDDPELSEEDMLAAVAVSFDGGRRRFPVVCTETPSLTAGGVWKEGMYYVHRDCAKDSIKCPCCLKHLPRMSREQFVRHADPRFAGIEGKTPWDFLFVLHRDGSVVSPLAPFLKLLEKRKSELGDAALISPNQKRNYQNDFKIPLRTAEPQVEDAEAVKTAENNARKKLESVVIARRAAGHAEPKSSSPSSKPMYVIRIVCVSSKLTIPMADGMVQNKLDRSTLGDFPYKDGWLFFDKGTPAGTDPSTSTAVSPLYANVLCECCGREMPLEDFVAHTGLGPWNKKFKHRFVYAPLRDNQRALIEFDRVWQSILTLYKHQALESFMSTISEVNVRL